MKETRTHSTYIRVTEEQHEEIKRRAIAGNRPISMQYYYYLIKGMDEEKRQEGETGK